MHDFFAARTAFIDDFLVAASAAGIRQVVVLARVWTPGDDDHGPTVDEISYAEQRTDVVEWLTEHGWEASAATIPDVVSRYRRGVVATNETSSVPSVLISGYRAE